MKVGKDQRGIKPSSGERQKRYQTLYERKMGKKQNSRREKWQRQKTQYKRKKAKRHNLISRKDGRGTKARRDRKGLKKNHGVVQK